MKAPQVRVTALGHYHPPQVIGNQLFEDLEIGSDSEWIAERTGISERRSCLNEEQIRGLRSGDLTPEQIRDDEQTPKLADLAEQSWRLLCERKPDASQNLDLILCGTSVPDYEIPANACAIAGKIGLQAPAFDVNSACSSFVVNLHTASAFIRSGVHRKVALFLPERYTYRLDFTDRTSSVLFGDGCACALVEADSNDDNSSSDFEVLDTAIESDPSKFDLVKIEIGKNFYQNGKAVQKFAITRTIESTKVVLERTGYSIDQVDYFVGHQANFRMLSSAAQKMGIPPERHLYNVDRFGNQGGAGAPSVLSMNWDKFKSGDLVVTAVVGSGLTWGAALLRKL